MCVCSFTPLLLPSFSHSVSNYPSAFFSNPCASHPLICPSSWPHYTLKSLSPSLIISPNCSLASGDESKLRLRVLFVLRMLFMVDNAPMVKKKPNLKTYTSLGNATIVKSLLFIVFKMCAEKICSLNPYW